MSTLLIISVVVGVIGAFITPLLSRLVGGMSGEFGPNFATCLVTGFIFALATFVIGAVLSVVTAIVLLANGG